MKGKLLIGLLLGLNFLLAAFLIAALMAREEGITMGTKTSADMTQGALAERVAATAPEPPNAAAQVGSGDAPKAPFARMYSDNPKDFAANLRAIHCPEATVRDIIAAEITRKYQTQEDALRPKPADHVPMGWSSATSEAKLLQRRLQIASLARQKAGEIGGALGYSVPVSLPHYAVTATDQRFEAEWAKLPQQKLVLLNQAQEDYWAKARALLERTRGFWQSEDHAELQRLKTEWRDQIQRIREAQ